MVLEDLAWIEQSVVDRTVKGMPAWCSGMRLSDIGKAGWNLLRGDVGLPAAILRRDELENNLRWMQALTRTAGVSLCPHGKTTMAPQLFEMQLEYGAWGMTAATVPQLAVYRRSGVQRVIYANQLTGRADIEYVLEELGTDPDFQFYFLLDSAVNLDFILEVIGPKPPGRPLNALLEIGMKGGRTGVRTEAEAMRLASRIAAAHPYVRLCGFEAFEGVFNTDSAEGRACADEMLDRLCRIAAACEAKGWLPADELLLTAGGTTYFDEVIRRLTSADLPERAHVVIRSGCYLTSDDTYYGAALERIRERSALIRGVHGRLHPAMEVWARIQSVPEPGLAIAGMGKRDVSHDAGLPVLKHVSRARGAGGIEDARGLGSVVRLNDQHAFIEMSASGSLSVGDLAGFGIAHPCTTFDKWELIFLVDSRYDITGAVKTFF
jgi:D-serine dehydratase